MQPLLHSYLAWSLLPLSQGSGGQDQQGVGAHRGPSCTGPPSLLAGVSGPVSINQIPSSFLKLPSVWSLLHTGPFYKGPLLLPQHKRDFREKAGEPTELSRSCGNSPDQSGSITPTCTEWVGPLSTCSK